MKLNRPGWLRFWGLALLLVLGREGVADAPSWQTVSKATDRWLWLELYEATLERAPHSRQKAWWDEGVPLRLTLCYRRPIKREWLIEAAETHLPKTLHDPLREAVRGVHQAYRDVNVGDCYQLSHLADGRTQLALNGELQFETRQAGFKALYFGLWLGDEPLSRPLMEALTKSL